MQNEELFYDTNEAIKFISERTGINPNVVEKVLDADVEFMRKIGIIRDEEDCKPSSFSRNLHSLL